METLDKFDIHILNELQADARLTNTELAQRVGLLDYWRSGRAPDFCRKQPEPICAQLLKRR